MIERDAMDQSWNIAEKFSSDVDISITTEPIPGANFQKFKVSIEGIEASKYLLFKKLASIDS
jgi:hypothetical protein